MTDDLTFYCGFHNGDGKSKPAIQEEWREELKMHPKLAGLFLRAMHEIYFFLINGQPIEEGENHGKVRSQGRFTEGAQGRGPWPEQDKHLPTSSSKGKAG